ncbi:hypothetical protein WJX84_010994 [Apatococcus fuscideae]|uniref:U-box domain-containing protein n=1 Tax=Apatococcus fuscideae TaxID=2026836 RepID=A0AAW1TGP9_9CHLO
MPVICLGPVCVPLNLLVPFLVGLLHRYGYLKWFKQEWVTLRYWRRRWTEWQGARHIVSGGRVWHTLQGLTDIRGPIQQFEQDWSHGTNMALPRINHFKGWEVRSEDVTFLEVLGEGQHGKVWKAQLGNGREMFMFSEFCERGDLYHAIQIDAEEDQTRQLGWQLRGKKIAVDIARGLACLHQASVIHFDIKSFNILLSDSWSAKLADVGNILGLEVPRQCPQEVAEIIDRCCSPDPQARPTATELVRRLEALQTTGVASSAVPVPYKCHLTRRLMEDPVILVESGMVYERWAIQEWLAIGNNTCPCSYIELPSNGGTPVATLLPNDVLSQAIRQWQVKNPQSKEASQAGNDRDGGSRLCHPQPGLSPYQEWAAVVELQQRGPLRNHKGGEAARWAPCKAGPALSAEQWQAISPATEEFLQALFCAQQGLEG